MGIEAQGELPDIVATLQATDGPVPIPFERRGRAWQAQWRSRDVRWISTLLEYADAGVDAWMNGTDIGQAIAGETEWSDVGPSFVGGLASAVCVAGVAAATTVSGGGAALLGLGCAGFGELVGRGVEAVYY